MLRNVFLHGHLKEKYGEKIIADVNTFSDVLRLMKANNPDFFQVIRDGDYRILRETDNGDLDEKETLTEDMLTMNFPTGDFHFIPVVSGSGSGKGIFGIIAGVILIAVAWWNPLGWAAGITSIMGSVGASLVLTGVSALLTPTPSSPKNKDEEKQKSFLFSGQPLATEQGVPVPIIYGEYTVGAIIVSGGIVTEDQAV